MSLFAIGPRSASGAKQRMFLIELGRCGYARRNRKILKERAPISQQLQCPLWVKTRHVQRIRRCPLVPIADIALFDHLISAGEQRRGNFESERFRSLEVDC